MRGNARKRHGPPPANCTACGKQLQTKKPHRPHGSGRAHQSCIKALNRAAAPLRTPISSTPAPHTPIRRVKRPYDTLQPTQQWKRKQKLRTAVAAAELEADCPLTAVRHHATTPPEELIHLPTSVRNAIRTVPSLRIPSEATSFPRPRVGGAHRIIPRFFQRPLPQAASKPVQQHSRAPSPLPC